MSKNNTPQCPRLRPRLCPYIWASVKFTFGPVQRHSRWQSVPDADWADWRWQMRNSLSTMVELEGLLELSESERAGFRGLDRFQVRVTPYYLSLVDPRDPLDPIRRIFMPAAQELVPGLQQMPDPLAEKSNQPVSRIIHRYPDRALFLITDVCSVYCRFCTRKYFTAQDQYLVPKDEYSAALNYLREHTGIREVILSGGDPLTLSNGQLDRILTDLRSIEHLEIIRIGSRMPTVNPFRLDSELSDILRKHAPVYLMSHFSHPRELTAEAVSAVEKIVDRGTLVMNQFVLLNGINNDTGIVQALCRRLLNVRVKPYYMFQCDPSMGTDHLRTSVEQSMQIQRELWGALSGLAMPQLALDIPEGGGKVGLVPNFELSRNENTIFYKGWDGVQSKYVSPVVSERPSDADVYTAEWNSLQNAKSQVKVKTEISPGADTALDLLTDI
jgi:lysine 2,3-aminomutase